MDASVVHYWANDGLIWMQFLRRVARVPARINILGEHTDRYGGLSLPFACQYQLVLTATRRNEGFSGESGVVQLWKCAGGWPADLVVESDIPIGAGMSSSAALCVAIVMCAQGKQELMQVCLEAQRIEHEVIGTQCGLLDQIAITHSSKGKAIRIDFGKNELQTITLPENWHFKLVDSRVRRKLSDSNYAQEDVASVSFSSHVLDENNRVEEALNCDAIRLGEMINESHFSMRDRIKVSTPEIDQRVNELQNTEGVLGARIMGGGFGGMILTLVEHPSILDEDLIIASDSASLEEFF